MSVVVKIVVIGVDDVVVEVVDVVVNMLVVAVVDVVVEVVVVVGVVVVEVVVNVVVEVVIVVGDFIVEVKVDVDVEDVVVVNVVVGVVVDVVVAVDVVVVEVVIVVDVAVVVFEMVVVLVLKVDVVNEVDLVIELLIAVVVVDSKEVFNLIQDNDVESKEAFNIIDVEFKAPLQASWFCLTPFEPVDLSTSLEDMALTMSKIENLLPSSMENFSFMYLAFATTSLFFLPDFDEDFHSIKSFSRALATASMLRPSLHIVTAGNSSSVTSLAVFLRVVMTRLACQSE